MKHSVWRNSLPLNSRFLFSTLRRNARPAHCYQPVTEPPTIDFSRQLPSGKNNNKDIHFIQTRTLHMFTHAIYTPSTEKEKEMSAGTGEILLNKESRTSGEARAAAVRWSRKNSHREKMGNSSLQWTSLFDVMCAPTAGMDPIHLALQDAKKLCIPLNVRYTTIQKARQPESFKKVEFVPLICGFCLCNSICNGIFIFKKASHGLPPNAG